MGASFALMLGYSPGLLVPAPAAAPPGEWDFPTTPGATQYAPPGINVGPKTWSPQAGSLDSGVWQPGATQQLNIATAPTGVDMWEFDRQPYTDQLMLDLGAPLPTPATFVIGVYVRSAAIQQMFTNWLWYYTYLSVGSPSEFFVRGNGGFSNRFGSINAAGWAAIGVSHTGTSMRCEARTVLGAGTTTTSRNEPTFHQVISFLGSHVSFQSDSTDGFGAELTYWKTALDNATLTAEVADLYSRITA